MIWNSVKDVFTIEKKGEGAIKQLFEKAGYPELADSVLERERFFSSSIGKGIYLIRRMSDVEEPVLFIGKSREPMELEAYDGFPVRLLILALVPEDEKLYASYLATLFRLLNISSLREELLEVRNEEEAASVFRREEEG